MGINNFDCHRARLLVKLQVRAQSKEKILRELTLLGIDHFSIFGDLEHLAEWLKGAHK
jgi:hypothetical protein